MSYQVRLEPSGETFEAEQHDTLLEAALRAGLPLDYGCSNGNCGQCQARVVSGEVARVRHHDYVISEGDRARGYILLCSYAARGDLVVEAGIAGGSEEIPLQELRAKVRKLERVNEEVTIVHLRTPRSQRLRFLAGQYVTLRAGGLPDFDASIASCPCDDMRLEVHIRHQPGEPFSEHIFRQARVGQEIEVEGPKGDFVLKGGRSDPLVLIAFDTGFAAMKSLFEHATAQDEDRRIHLCWLTCDARRPYMHDLCRSWSDAFDHFHYAPLSLNEEYAAVAGPRETPRDRLSEYLDGVIAECSDLSQAHAYLAAPVPIVERVKGALIEAGMPPSHILVEPVHGNENATCLIDRQ